MPLSYWFMVVMASETPTSQDLAQALEFQYKQKLESIEAENLALKAQVQKLKAKNASLCPTNTKDSKAETFDLTPTVQTKREKAAEEQKVYKNALRFVNLEMWDDAILAMENFARDFSESDLADNAIFWMAQIYMQKKEVGLARAELERLLQLYPKSDRAVLAEARLKTIPQLTQSSNDLAKESLTHETK